MTIQWLKPNTCLPPHRVTHPEKLEYFLSAFTTSGWDVQMPSLVGYQRDNYVQLLSGSHRWAAANKLKMRVPVIVYEYVQIAQAYGNIDEWEIIMTSGEIPNAVEK
jgi:hypothetical protein